ncbi:serine/threonine-protein phosphatase 4 regulatory subunit 1-like isoform X2 [Diorhabda sublineata]|uniref:serine/threonine-protein phosphatase 4 regulatory subunit 1-like isoform X2 n=1 Tax=Diorhabda sublineata TaxID=1163346 RepID=UPI0024E17892|nr:serine/threonine-protein phosphatase 4 regulatory subunit 1-like isoform X2 [Diorhabda sublineata]
MADVPLINDECMNDPEEGFEKSLTPLKRIQYYAKSTQTCIRYKLPKAVLDEFRTCPPEILIEDLPDIMKILTEVSGESILRAELLEQIPHIAAQALACSTRVSAFKNVVGDYLIPLLVRNLGCYDITSTLIQLIEQRFISKLQAEIQICPTILALTKSQTAAEVQITAVDLMSKLAPLLGRDVTERVFLGRFAELCSSSKSYIRKVCAAYFGHFCAVVSRESVEKILLPQYLTLCVDETWLVRKSCAYVVTYVSCACTYTTRTTKLAPAFAVLLQDDCRWVRVSAFQSLGHFISTFANPPITMMEYNSNGDLVLIDGAGREYFVPTLTMTERVALLSTEKFNFFAYYDDYDVDTEELIANGSDVTAGDSNELQETKSGDNYIENLINIKDILEEPNNVISSKTECDTSEIINKELKDDKQNIKLCVNNTDINIENSKNLNSNDKELCQLNSNVCKEENKDIRDNDIKVTSQNNSTLNNTTDNNNSTISLEDIDEQNKGQESKDTAVNEEPEQTIVPQILIDRFISMTYPILSLNVEDEVAYYCAQFLPAVVLTLGRSNWHLLKDTVFSLAGNMQYKVRRTVASSLHELAIILGPEIATNSLTQLFEGFLKDLDEVRIGILRHLAAFLKLIDAPKRNTYLPRFSEFLQTDNEWNWRFREKLANQLLKAMDLFKPKDVAKHIFGISMDLLSDKVAAVRQAALALVVKLISYTSSELNLTSNLLMKLVENFAHSKKWKRRQTFCLLCIELLKEDALDYELFISEVMPHLLDLSWDPVANIRLVVARCISKYIYKNEKFIEASRNDYEGIEAVLRRLQADKDCDVRQCAEI